MAAQWVEQALASLVGGPTFASLRTEVKKGDMVAHTFNLSTWEVERNGWGEREKEGKGKRKKGEGKNCFFFLDSVFSIVDETLSAVSATYQVFDRSSSSNERRRKHISTAVDHQALNFQNHIASLGIDILV